MDAASKQSQLHVVMLPWLAHGHAYCYLELGKRLIQEVDCLHVHFCSTPVILDSVRDHLHRLLPQPRINLVEICLPELPELPAHLHCTKHLPSHLGPTLNSAFAQSEESFAQILEKIKPDILIFDMFQPWAAKLARKRNIPAVMYAGSTVAISWFVHQYSAPDKEYPFPAISIMKDYRRHTKDPAEDEKNVRRVQESFILCCRLSDFVIARSFREVDSKYTDYLSALIGKEVVPTGPLIPEISSVSRGDAQEAEVVMHWLDQRTQRSAVFVSFGSECFMPYNEMEQLAHGLELSGACFIWVARFPKIDEKGNDSYYAKAHALLHGLMERVGPQRGLVVTSWAPQRKILVHPNLGSFLTHCGWSSVIEGMHACVPMLALPMNWDQPMNAKLMVELGIAVEIPQRGLGNFKAEDVAASIKLILLPESGIRKNAKDLAAMVRNRTDDDFRMLANKIFKLASKAQVI